MQCNARAAATQVPLLCHLVPRQRKAMAAVELIRATTNDLIRQCKEMVDEEEMAAASAATAEGREYMNASDPSVLRFLIAAREEVDSTQLRDDLLSMLVAGHETTGSALTWTLYLLVNNPDKMAIAQAGAGKRVVHPLVFALDEHG
jgi:carotene epsilon-monooxygenase